MQGRSLLQDDIENILHLLRTTDMTIPEIARRTGFSAATINGINSSYVVRLYKERTGTYWILISTGELIDARV